MKAWARPIIDRSAELREWVDVCLKISGLGVPIFALANNHFAGNGPAVPGNVERASRTEDKDKTP
jgi:hypothetical protein